MQITEVRIKLIGEANNERLSAFASVTFGDEKGVPMFVVRDLKVINGRECLFVAMPSRKLTDHCPACSRKNRLRARYCSSCGAKLAANRECRGEDGRAKLHADIAHPINSEFRKELENAVIPEYYKELELCKDANYVCRYEFWDNGSVEFEDDEVEWFDPPKVEPLLKFPPAPANAESPRLLVPYDKDHPNDLLRYATS